MIEHIESLDNFKKIKNTSDYIKQIEEINESLKKISKKSYESKYQTRINVRLDNEYSKKTYIP